MFVQENQSFYGIQFTLGLGPTFRIKSIQPPWEVSQSDSTTPGISVREDQRRYGSRVGLAERERMAWGEHTILMVQTQVSRRDCFSLFSLSSFTV
jgi:hypothetical protein